MEMNLDSGKISKWMPITVILVGIVLFSFLIWGYPLVFNQDRISSDKLSELKKSFSLEQATASDFQGKINDLLEKWKVEKPTNPQWKNLQALKAQFIEYNIFRNEYRAKLDDLTISKADKEEGKLYEKCGELYRDTRNLALAADLTNGELTEKYVHEMLRQSKLRRDILYGHSSDPTPLLIVAALFTIFIIIFISYIFRIKNVTIAEKVGWAIPILVPAATYWFDRLSK